MTLLLKHPPRSHRRPAFPLPVGQAGDFPCRPPPGEPPGPGGIAFAAGGLVPELLRHTESARRLARAGGSADLARELASRAALLRGLLAPEGAALLLRLCAVPATAQAGRFGYWLTRLQAAWYAQEPAAALEAVQHAAALGGPQTSTGDLMLYHTFAVSALARWQDGVPLDDLARHGEALRRLDQRCQVGGGAMHALALAACGRRRGDGIAALRGFELAAGDAARCGLHWLAALSYEQAATQADEAGLAAAAHHYRVRCLAHYRHWGALGRVHDLQRLWGEPAEIDSGCRLAPAIVHELNQPLAAIALHAAAAAKWLHRAAPDVERALDSLALIGSAGRQAHDIARGLHRLAASLPLETAAVDVDETVRETLLLLRHRLCEQRIDVELALDLAGCMVAANRTQLKQVLTNLLVNAIEAHAAAASADVRRIRVASRRDGRQAIELTVRDNGPGIAPRHRPQVLSGAFTTKRDSGGGMGLAVCLAIVRAHGGDIRFEPCAPRGACFRVRLPLPVTHQRSH